MDDPHVTSHQELQQCIAELEEFFESLADVNAGVSKIALRKLRRVKKLVLESPQGEAQKVVRSLGRAVCHELVAEAVKWIVETLIRIFPALLKRVKAYDTRLDDKGVTSFSRTEPTGSGKACRYFGIVSFAA